AGAAGAQALLDLLPDLERDLRFRALPGPLAVVSLGVPRPDDHGEHAAVAVLPVHLVLPEARLGHARELPRRIRVIHVSVDPIDVFGEVVLNAGEVPEVALGPRAREVDRGRGIGAETAGAIEIRVREAELGEALRELS